MSDQKGAPLTVPLVLPTGLPHHNPACCQCVNKSARAALPGAMPGEAPGDICCLQAGRRAGSQEAVYFGGGILLAIRPGCRWENTSALVMVWAVRLPVGVAACGARRRTGAAHGRGRAHASMCGHMRAPHPHARKCILGTRASHRSTCPHARARAHTHGDTHSPRRSFIKPVNLEASNSLFIETTKLAKINKINANAKFYLFLSTPPLLTLCLFPSLFVVLL